MVYAPKYEKTGNYISTNTKKRQNLSVLHVLGFMVNSDKNRNLSLMN